MSSIDSKRDSESLFCVSQELLGTSCEEFVCLDYANIYYIEIDRLISSMPYWPSLLHLMMLLEQTSWSKNKTNENWNEGWKNERKEFHFYITIKFSVDVITVVWKNVTKWNFAKNSTN